jgi:hypothetical protein
MSSTSRCSGSLARRPALRPANSLARTLLRWSRPAIPAVGRLDYLSVPCIGRAASVGPADVPPWLLTVLRMLLLAGSA